MDSPNVAATTTDPSLKRKRGSHSRSRIVIELPSKRPRYDPRTGPPPLPISLLPAQDSTAYILERILLPPPGLAADGKLLPKRMAYIVCWHDLPAARMLVPAMKVLDYVSPRALEEWEYNMELEMDKERERMEEEKQQKTPKTKRRGRPPAHSQIEAAVVAGPDNEALRTGRPTSGVMSIMSPSKARLATIVIISDDDESPSRQLEQESRSSMDVQSREDSKELSLVRGLHSLEDSNEDITSRKSAKPYGPRETGASYSAPIPARMKSDLQTSTKQKAPLRSTPEASASTPATSAIKIVKETKVPLPNIIGFPGASRTSSWSVQRTSPSTLGQFTSVSTTDKTVMPSTEAPPKTPAAKLTPNPQPNPQPRASSKKPKTERKKPPNTKPPTPKPQEIETQTEDEPVWEVKRIEGTEVYEVEGKGLVRYFKILWEGNWPPDQNPSWEPEENLPPSLVHSFMKKTQKKATPKKATPKKVTPKKKPSKQQSILPWATGSQFKSVSEAFAGGEDIDLPDVRVDDTDTAYNEKLYDAQEEFIVVEEPPAKKAHKRGSVGWNRTGNGDVSASRKEFGLGSAFH